MCDEAGRYLIDDRVFIWGNGFPDGPAGALKQIDLPFTHPDAYELEMQINFAFGAGSIEVYDSATQDMGRLFLIGAAPDQAVAGVQPPTRRLLKKKGASLFAQMVGCNQASVSFRLYGKRRG